MGVCGEGDPPLFSKESSYNHLTYSNQVNHLDYLNHLKVSLPSAIRLDQHSQPSFPHESQRRSGVRLSSHTTSPVENLALARSYNQMIGQGSGLEENGLG